MENFFLELLKSAIILNRNCENNKKDIRFKNILKSIRTSYQTEKDTEAMMQ